jgi:quercetin dioxygenase-like cupin family protein
MNRVILPLVLTVATVAVAWLARAGVPQSATENPSGPTTSRPLILQEGEGDQLVHSAGPLSGVPFIIKVDGQNGNAQDFFVFTETLARGQTIPFHKHDNTEEILFFEEGGTTVIVGDKRAVAGPRSIVFIPRDTWISAANNGKQDIHVVSVFSRQGFESYLRAISAKAGQPVTAVRPDELPGLRAHGHAMYWDTTKGPYPPGVAHP